MDTPYTPYLKINNEKLLTNIKTMQGFAHEQGIELRPHFKTHKTIEIAKLQKKAGAVGFTVSKLSEAETLVGHGFSNILIAYPVVGERNIKRFLDLSEKVKISVAMDDIDSIKTLGKAFESKGKKIDLLLEIDTGLNRLGVLPKEGINRAELIKNIPGINFIGLLTHAGHSYGANNIEEVKLIGEDEGKTTVGLAQEMSAKGIGVNVISVGSTPTVLYSGKIKGVTEIRPGNYVFYDNTQISLGVVKEDQCSLTVVSTIVGHPTEKRFIIDAGSKTLALDAGAHGKTTVKGYGRIKGHGNLSITKLSEEHGIVEINGGSDLKIGDMIEIIPNHCCPVVNLSDKLHVFSNNTKIDEWIVEGRGNNW